MAEKIPPQDTPNNSFEDENQNQEKSSGDEERARNAAKFEGFQETVHQLKDTPSIQELFKSYDAKLHGIEGDPLIFSAFFNAQNFAAYIREQVFLEQVDLQDVITRLRAGVAEAEENTQICIDQRVSYVKTGNESIDLYITEWLGERIVLMRLREENAKEALAMLEETYGKYLAADDDE